jgi:hypothetical protein
LPKTLPRFLACLFVFVAMILLVEQFFGIWFETNDDVGMMMMAHGFGVAGEATPLLLFSSLWQGYIVQALGWPFGFPGYGVYLMGALAVALAAQAAFLGELTGRVWLSLLLVAALAVRPVFAPQFTVIAGYLAAASFLALLAYQARPRLSVLLSAATLAFASFLMREHIFVLAALVAAPLVLRVPLLRDWRAWAVACGVVALAVVARLHHQSVLDGPEWAGFVAQNLPRALFTDFNLTPHVLASPEAMRAAGWSVNDVRLLEMWWLADPALAGPGPLRAAIDVVGVGSIFGLDAARLAQLSAELTRPDLLAAALATLLAGITLRGAGLLRLLAGSVALVALALLITASGRLDISRVYFPVLVMLALLAAAAVPRRAWTALPIGLAAVVAGWLSLGNHIPVARAVAASLPDIQAVLSRAEPGRVHVVWGDTLPFQRLYPPLARRDSMSALRLYGIGSASYAGYALARFGGDPRGVVTALRSAEGVSLFAYHAGIPLLRTYCAERYQGELQVEPLAEAPRFLFGIFRCRPMDAATPSR